jgi:hypothetical protein
MPRGVHSRRIPSTDLEEVNYLIRCLLRLPRTIRQSFFGSLAVATNCARAHPIVLAVYMRHFSLVVLQLSEKTDCTVWLQ